MNSAASRPLDVCIRGQGAVGSCLALALSRQGWQVGLAGLDAAAAPRRGPDVRAYALNAASAALLRELRVWDALPADAITPVDAMDVRGDDGGQLGFSAWTQAVDALAWIVDAAALDEALAQALHFAPHVQRLKPDDPRMQARPAGAATDLARPLLAVCEGRDSATREALGADWHRHGYGHQAIAARLVADRPHQGVARQWFRSPDILALLPFDRPAPGHAYALVWSLPDAQVAELQALDDAAFEAALNAASGGAASGGAAGTLRLAGPRVAWPLMLAQAQRWCGPGWVLLGDAAHAVHPLAGQGLNLGLGDVRALVDVLVAARADTPWRAAGDERTLRRYVRRRQTPTHAMGTLTDGLLHLFAAQDAPLRSLRNVGMSAVDRLGPVKRWLTARALDA
ncbi:FAD-dependent monooxygenase [Leptothrix discophora]|uniref:FAD-dependent monooxygenase n=1 Tax=Leptothrix discophora TaxID=89 RepID=A0ABT9G8E8_LEPDI|nr:FAD-dependent monooxygenase [Leptothrix discophora]MDP4302567.1 FAD-dependent monooxygenase [Leptothrix discophora]